MKIAGLPMTDVWAHRALRERGVEFARLEKEPGEIGVVVQSVDLEHHGPEQKYRPYLHLFGELRSVRPAQALPYGIDEVTFPPGGGETVSAIYEFDDDQLAQLVSKGYFSDDFTVPGQIVGIEWELPATVDSLVLAPTGASEGDDPDIPVVFVNVHDLGALGIDLESSEYDLAEYFADRSTTLSIGKAAPVVVERGLRSLSDPIDPLFSEDELAVGPQDVPVVPDKARADKESTATAGGLDLRLQAVETALADEHERLRLERSRVEGTPENLYQQRVAGLLQAAEKSEQAAPEPVGQDLDLGDEFPERLSDEPVGTGRGRESLEATERKVAERAAALEHDEEPAAGHEY